MKLILEKRTADNGTEGINNSNVESIKKILGRQNKIESEYIDLFPQSNQNLKTFFESLIGPGDEVLTVGPTTDNICRAITSCNASYFEFYEKPIFMPDSLGLIGKITPHSKMIVLGNPNRFTGVVYSEKEIEDVLNISRNIIVVLDESTYQSSRITAIDLIKKYDNLALFRQFENGKTSFLKYVISSPAVIEKITEGRLDIDYYNMDVFGALDSLKNTGYRIGRIKDARQEMLYLSIRLRMFGIECFLLPDYSLVIKSANSNELLLLLDEMGVPGLDLSSYPGLDGNILLQFDIDINVMEIIDIFENMSIEQRHNKLERNRLTIYRPSESDFEFEAELSREIDYGDRLKNNMVF